MADFDAIWRHFHGNWSANLMVVTTDQAQFWAHDSFHPPVFAKDLVLQIDMNIVLVVLHLLFKFWDIFSTFDHLVKDMQVVRAIFARESRTKPREMWEKSNKDDTWTGF
jgi:hypothetical protein